jgi:hypothetical protein
MLKTDTLDTATAAHAAIILAAGYLELAIATAAAADCPRIVVRLKSQRKAIDGAIRHAAGRVSRAERGAPMRRRGIAGARTVAPAAEPAPGFTLSEPLHSPRNRAAYRRLTRDLAAIGRKYSAAAPPAAPPAESEVQS